jgi:hypothetical protein
MNRNAIKGKSESKVQPRTSHKGLEREWRYISTLSSTSVLDGSGEQRHTPAALPPGKKPGTHCTGLWVGARSGLEIKTKCKIKTQDFFTNLW